MFFDIVEIKSFGMSNRVYVIDIQWLKLKGDLPAMIH